MMENKEVYRDISEIKERTASIETQLQILNHTLEKIEEAKDTAVRAESKADSAHRRINVIDKWMFAIGSTVILAIIGSVLGLLFI